MHLSPASIANIAAHWPTLLLFALAIVLAIAFIIGVVLLIRFLVRLSRKNATQPRTENPRHGS